MIALIYYGSIAFIIGMGCLGVAIGQERATNGVLQAMTIQPAAHATLSRILMIGLGLIESAGILALLTASRLVLGSSGAQLTDPVILGTIGIAGAMGISCAVVSIASSLPIQAAAFAIARQPFFAQKIQLYMLLAVSLMQTSVIRSEE